MTTDKKTNSLDELFNAEFSKIKETLDKADSKFGKIFNPVFEGIVYVTCTLWLLGFLCFLFLLPFAGVVYLWRSLFPGF